MLFGCAPGNVSDQRYFRNPAVAGVTPTPAPHKQTCCHGSSSPRAPVPPRTLTCPWELLPAHVSRVSSVRRQRGRISPDDPERRSRMCLIRLVQCDEQEMTSWLCWPGHVNGSDCRSLMLKLCLCSDLGSDGILKCYFIKGQCCKIQCLFIIIWLFINTVLYSFLRPPLIL